MGDHEDNVFTFLRKDGKMEVLTGANAGDALDQAGYREEALNVFCSSFIGDVSEEWAWDENENEWKKEEFEW